MNRQDSPVVLPLEVDHKFPTFSFTLIHNLLDRYCFLRSELSFCKLYRFCFVWTNFQSVNGTSRTCCICQLCPSDMSYRSVYLYKYTCLAISVPALALLNQWPPLALVRLAKNPSCCDNNVTVLAARELLL